MENQGVQNPVVWFEIYVDDMERARKFYETVLDVQLSDMSDPSDQNMQMATFPMAPGVPNASGALVQMEGMKAGGASTIVYFSTEDCTTEENRVAEAGGSVMKPKMAIGEYGFITLATDTEGNVFGLHSRK